jgi:isocitrate dehydrogenase kinase/phosphatase
MVTNDARCTRDIKSRIAVAKAAFNKRKTLFTRRLDLHLEKKLVKCYIWSIICMVLKLRNLDQKYLERFEMWNWKKMQKIIRTDRVKVKRYCIG